MSTLIVDVVKIKEVTSHPNADRLEIAHIKGWSCIVGKDSFKTGDLGVYFPVDAVLDPVLSDRLGVTNYLSKGRIRAARLRGFVSYGLLIPNEGSWEEGTNLVDHYDVKKYEPPLEFSMGGQVESPHPKFIKYTDIENHKNFPGIFQDGEEVIATEKLHGTNTRVGLFDGDFMAGSHNQQLKETLEGEKECLYWWPLKDDKVRDLLKHLGNAILFGEIFGSKVQRLHYGLENGRKAFRAFDIFHEDHYMNWCEYESLCNRFGVQMTPIIYKGAYNFQLIHDRAQGPTIIEGATHIREGLVFKPMIERWNEQVGRVIMKHKSDEYELNANKLDNDQH